MLFIEKQNDHEEFTQDRLDPRVDKDPLRWVPQDKSVQPIRITRDPEIPR